MNNNLTAPFLLIAAMLVLILFQSVLFANEDVIYTDTDIETEEKENGEYITDYITVNNVKYKPDRFFILAVASNICAFLLPAVFYVKLKGAGYSKNLKLELPKLRYVPVSAYMFIVLISGTVLANSLVFYLSGAGAGADSGSVLPVMIHTGGNPVYDMGILIAFVILPAFCEEFFFRSVLSAEYEKYGAFCAVMMTSAAFAMIHFSVSFFPAYFIAAVVLYIMVKITNSVIYAVVLHAGYNFFNIYFWDRLSGVLDFEQNRFIFIFITAVIFLLFLIFVLKDIEGIYYGKAYRNEPSPVHAAENDNRAMFLIRFLKSFLSPVFIAAGIMFFVYINII